jgi:tryptophanyl-tRNA synthetase
MGDGGAGKLKRVLMETLNEYLRPLRRRRSELELNVDYVKQVLRDGILEARKIATETLEEVREVMNMKI